MDAIFWGYINDPEVRPSGGLMDVSYDYQSV